MADERDERALAAIETALTGCPSARFKVRLRKELETTIMMSSAAGTLKPAPGVRPGFTAVTPYLVAADVEQLIEFARRVFDAEETGRALHGPGGTFTHCEMRIGDSMVMLGGGAGMAPRPVGLHIYVDDADAVYQRALAAGAEALSAPEDKHYGERSGSVKDPAGNHWYIATRTGPSYFAERPRTVTPSVFVQAHPALGAPEFIGFLEAAFGARLEMRNDSPDGTVRHAVVRIEGATIEIGEVHEPSSLGTAGFYLYVKDCDALYRQAIAAGARSLWVPADMPYGDRSGGVMDAWGNLWNIATHPEPGITG